MALLEIPDIISGWRQTGLYKQYAAALFHTMVRSVAAFLAATGAAYQTVYYATQWHPAIVAPLAVAAGLSAAGLMLDRVWAANKPKEAKDPPPDKTA